MAPNFNCKAQSVTRQRIIDGALPHLENHDVTLTAVSRAPLTEIEAYKKRMGWKFSWVSAFGSDFN